MHQYKMIKMKQILTKLSFKQNANLVYQTLNNQRDCIIRIKLSIEFLSKTNGIKHIL